MRASPKKKTISPALTRRQREAAERKAGKRRLIAVLAVVVLVAALLAVLGYLLRSDVLSRRLTAVTVGDHKLSGAMFNYYYKQAYSDFTNTNSDYAGYLLDADTPLDEQYYDQDAGETWADYFIRQAAQDAAQTYAVYDRAVASGYTLSDEDQKQLDNTLYYVGMYAQYYGFPDADAYLADRYGKGCNTENYQQYAAVHQVVTSYSNAYKSSLTYSDEEISAYYAGHVDELDTVSYRIYRVSIKSGAAAADGPAIDPDASRNRAQAMASQSRNDEEAFRRLAQQYAPDGSKDFYADSSATLCSRYARSSVPSVLADWLYDAGRRAGDTTAVENGDDGYYVAFFLARSDNDFPMVNLHSAFLATQNADDPESDREAKKKAQSLLDGYLAGEHSEEAFEQIARKNSSNTGGGDDTLESNVAPKTYPNADGWLFDEPRKTGDTALFQVDGGYRVFYFSGYGDNYRAQLVTEALRDEAYGRWYAGQSAGLTPVMHPFGLRYMTK